MRLALCFAIQCRIVSPPPVNNSSSGTLLHRKYDRRQLALRRHFQLEVNRAPSPKARYFTSCVHGRQCKLALLDREALAG